MVPPSAPDSTYETTLSKCRLLASAENRVAGSKGSPMVSCSAAATKRRRKSS